MTTTQITDSDCMFFMDLSDEEWDALPRKVQQRIRALYANTLAAPDLLAALKAAQAQLAELIECTNTVNVLDNCMATYHEIERVLNHAEGRP